MTEAVIDQLANVSVVYTNAFGNQVTVAGIFENGFRAFDLGGVAVESNTPEVSIKTSDATFPTRGLPITVDGGAYVIRDIRPDNEGLTVLVLSEET